MPSASILADLVVSKSVSVEWSKRDRYKRIVGKVLLDGQDLNLEQIKACLEWHFKRYQGEQSVADRNVYAEAEEAVVAVVIRGKIVKKRAEGLGLHGGSLGGSGGKYGFCKLKLWYGRLYPALLGRVGHASVPKFTVQLAADFAGAEGEPGEKVRFSFSAPTLTLSPDLILPRMTSSAIS